jgi:hypothetical protein
MKPDDASSQGYLREDRESSPTVDAPALRGTYRRAMRAWDRGNLIDRVNRVSPSGLDSTHILQQTASFQKPSPLFPIGAVDAAQGSQRLCRYSAIRICSCDTEHVGKQFIPRARPWADGRGTLDSSCSKQDSATAMPVFFPSCIHARRGVEFPRVLLTAARLSVMGRRA